MKILLLDDLPDLMGLYTVRLRSDGHEVVMLDNMTGALRVLKQQATTSSPFDLLVTDLMLKRFEPEFRCEQEKVSKAMAQVHLSNIPTGQALGLRLWNAQLRTPYCYLSAHTALWMKGMDNEFYGATDAELALLRISKDRIKTAELGQTLSGVITLWKQKGWVK